MTEPWSVVGVLLFALQSVWGWLDRLPAWWWLWLLSVAALHNFVTRLTGAIYLHGETLRDELRRARERHER
jgi:hypothetical protein